MYFTNSCSSCGMPIGDIAAPFSQLRAKRLEEIMTKHKTTPYMMFANKEVKVDLTDIFDLFKVKNSCCRAHLNTSMDFYSYYNK